MLDTLFLGALFFWLVGFTPGWLVVLIAILIFFREYVRPEQKDTYPF